MGKSTFFVIVLAVCAGAAGGMASHLLLRSDSPSDSTIQEPPPREIPEVAAVDQTGLDELRTEIRGLRSQMSELTSKQDAAETRLDEVASEQVDEPGQDEAVANLLKRVGADKALTSKLGKVVALGSGGPGVFRVGGFGKAAELMGLPEDEKWAKIREDLSLDAWQEDELRRLADENREAAKKMFAPQDGEKVDFQASIAKMMEQRKKSNERVRKLLSDDQYKKFNEGGYGGAMGLGATTMSITYSSASMPKDEEGK